MAGLCILQGPHEEAGTIQKILMFSRRLQEPLPKEERGRMRKCINICIQIYRYIDKKPLDDNISHLKMPSVKYNETTESC